MGVIANEGQIRHALMMYGRNYRNVCSSCNRIRIDSNESGNFEQLVLKRKTSRLLTYS